MNLARKGSDTARSDGSDCRVEFCWKPGPGLQVQLSAHLTAQWLLPLLLVLGSDSPFQGFAEWLGLF